ncbi:hypothetical protein [Myroides odoratimimus]|uniref:hypothetical protein n=1 Tax=Myroides odoratimimus TaxID=76832 RepID=UPI003101AD42
MKKRLLPVALLLGTFAANAQVGIGTATPNKSAELLIESSNRGLLIPNVALTSATDRTTITNGNVQSLMVYATKISEEKDITPGYYYWDINKWVRLTADKDIPQIVVNNFQEIVNKDGDKVENIIKNIVKNTEGNVIYEGDILYHITKDGDKIVKKEIKDKLTSIVYDDASGDYIYYNEGAVDRNGKITGEGIRIKVKETVINKFGDIINNNTVQEHITNYLDGTHVGGNVYYDGAKLTYVTKDGDREEVSINQVVTANESKTAIITINKKQYYVSEEYLVENKGVVPTTVDASNLPKGIYAIDVVGGVVNNLEEIVNNGPVTVDGRTFKTVNDYITYLTESKGGFTKIIYDATTGDAIFQEWNETTNSWVNVDNTKFNKIVTDNETVTTLVENADGTYTYYNEKEIDANGQPLSGAAGVTIDPKEVSVALNKATNVYEFKNSNGDVIGEIDANANAIVYNDNSTNLGVTNVQGAIEKLLEKITTVEGTTGNLVVSGGLEFTAKTTGVKALLADANIQVANKGISTEKLDDKAVTNEKLGDKSVSADKMTSFTSENGTTNPVAEGQIPVADGIGGVAYKEISGETLKGKALTSGSISVIGGEKALLDTTKIEVTGGKNKGDVLVTTDVVLKDADGKDVMGADGNPVYVTEWVNPKDFVSGTVTAKNGVTVVNDKDGNSEFKLGGALTEATVIDTKEYTLAIANMDSVEKGKVLENNLVIADANGVLKQTSAKNLIEDAVEVGDLKAKALTTDGVIVIGTDSTSTTVLADNSLLADVKLNIGKDKITADHIATGAVTSDEILDGTIKPEDMASDGKSKVLVTGADGQVQWIDQSTLNNKDTFTGNAPISIVEGSTNTTGGKDYVIQIADADGTTAGVTKQAEVDPTILFKDGVASVNVENIAKTQGKALTSGSITVFGGEKALLDGTVIEVQGGDKDGQVLVTKTKEIVVGKDANGTDIKETHKVTEWVDPKDFVSGTVTANNGITVVNDLDGNSEFKLGGALTEATVIDTKDHTLAIANMDSVEKGKVLENNLVIADKEGVLKQTSAKNLIEDAVEAGNLEAKALKGVGITVTAGDKEGTDTSVASSLLKDVTLGIADGAVTSDKMKATVADGNGGSKNAEEGMVPVANADGTVTYNKVNAKHVTYTKPTEDNGLTSNTVEGAINELAGKKGDLKVAGGMLTIDDGGKDALRHDATISLNLEGMNAIKVIDGVYGVEDKDVILLGNAVNGDVIVNLPTATAANKGKKYTIKKYDAEEDNYVTVQGNIEGASELYTALPYSGWDLVSDGTQWQIVNKF